MAAIAKPRTLLWLVVLVGLGAAACALDMPVRGFVKTHVQPYVKWDIPHQLLWGLKGFVELVPIVFISWTVLRLDRRQGRKVAVRLIAAVIAAGAVSGTGKLLVGRHRPEPFKGQTWRQTWIDAGPRDRDSKMESFFSGHSAAAFAMATVLGAYYPPVRPVVLTLAGGCAASRVATEQHWTSDVYVGSLAGVFVGWALLPGRLRRGGRDRDLLQDKLAHPVGVG